MTDKFVSVDVPSAMSVGLKNWQDSFEIPVRTQEYQNWEKAFLSLFDRNLFFHPDPLHRDLFNAQYKIFTSSLPNILHAYIVTRRLAKEGKRPLFSEKANYNQGNFYKFLYSKDSSLQDLRLPGFKQRSRQLLTEILTRERFDHRAVKAVYTGKKLFNNKAASINPSFLDAFYFSENKITVLEKSPISWLGFTGNIFLAKHSLGQPILQAVDEFLELFEKYVNQEQFPVDGHLLARIRLMILTGLEAAYRVITASQDSANKLKGLPCFFAGAGNWFRRSIMLSLRKAGANVGAFNHGGDPGKVRHHMFYYCYFPVVDSFYTYSRKSAACFEDICGLFDKEHVFKTRIIPIAYPAYEDLLGDLHAVPVKNQVKTVMVMGYPFMQARHTYTSFVLYVLLLELKIIDVLKRNGYRVIYKAHPDNIRLGINPYADSGIKICDGKFEDRDILELNDAFVFTHSLTTAFPVALCTPKPVILFNDPYTQWNRDCFESLRRRCIVIDLNEENNGSFSFDENLLIRGLEEGTKKSKDTSFITDYLGLNGTAGHRRDDSSGTRIYCKEAD